MQNELHALDGDAGVVGDLPDFEDKARRVKLNAETRKKLMNEVGKLKLMPSMSSEAAVIRNYLDTVFSVSWGKYDAINQDLDAAMDILNQDHYGLDKIKERIIESLAVSHRVSEIKAPILCFVGLRVLVRLHWVNPLQKRWDDHSCA